MGKTATTYIDYQQRAAEFRVGDAVVPWGAAPHFAGRVVAVFPAIGMVDVEFSIGNKRYPVEDLQRIRPSQPVIGPVTDSVPGGAGTVPVPNGPYKNINVVDRPTPVVEVGEQEEASLRQERQDRVKASSDLAARVATAFVKKAVYWNGADRKYRATTGELTSKVYYCPKCKDVPLKKAVYKRVGGQSERLFGCPSCLFLIHRRDLIGHPDCEVQGVVQ
jgi:hypothetical protein